jgi:hypothetical protein
MTNQNRQNRGGNFGKKCDKKENRTANKVLPKAGLNGFDWTFLQGSTFLLRFNFSAKNSRLRQYPARYLLC